MFLYYPHFLACELVIWGEFLDKIQIEVFGVSSLLFLVTSTALPWDFYFFKLTQPLLQFL